MLLKVAPGWHRVGGLSNVLFQDSGGPLSPPRCALLLPQEMVLNEHSCLAR